MSRMLGLLLWCILPASIWAQEKLPIRASAAFMRHLDSRTQLLNRDTVRLYFRRDSIPVLGDTIDPRFYLEVKSWYRELGEFPQDGDLFAISRIKLGDGFTAYIVRAPSQYSPTAIDVWPFNPTDSTLGPPVRAADAFGDGMWYFRRDAWLVDVDGDRVRDIVQRRRDWWEDDDTGKEQQSDSLFVTPRRSQQFQARRLSVDQRLRRAFDISDWQSP